jgi:hypothetical protein
VPEQQRVGFEVMYLVVLIVPDLSLISIVEDKENPRRI